MALRLIEVYLPEEHAGEIAELLADAPPIGLWRISGTGGVSGVKILVDAERSEAVLDALETRFKDLDGFRAVLVRVEAAIPRPEEPTNASEERVALLSEPEPIPGPARISREEL